jgi:hypothetical protein
MVEHLIVEPSPRLFPLADSRSHSVASSVYCTSGSSCKGHICAEEFVDGMV